MKFHQIHYELGCRQCNSRKLPAIAMLKTEIDDNQFSREELIEIMGNFSEISCENCGNIGHWICFKIFIDGKDDVREQFKINIFKENGEIWGKPEDGKYSPAHIEVSMMLIRERIEKELSNYYPPKPKGSAFIMIDFINDEPFSRMSAFDLDGLTVEEVSDFIDALTGKKAPKGISLVLRTKLEAAFEDLKNDTKNPLVIGHLKDNENIVNIYLIAKDPNEDMYYGILESELDSQRKIAGIPSSNIKALEVVEMPMIPFGARKYLENGIKE